MSIHIKKQPTDDTYSEKVLVVNRGHEKHFPGGLYQAGEPCSQVGLVITRYDGLTLYFNECESLSCLGTKFYFHGMAFVTTSRVTAKRDF